MNADMLVEVEVFDELDQLEIRKKTAYLTRLGFEPLEAFKLALASENLTLSEVLP